MHYDLANLIYGLVALLCSVLISFAMTPVVRVLAFKIGAIDVPLDQRRMHKKPIPRIGGLAIFVAFTVSTLIFCEPSAQLYSIWIGGGILVVIGILDDIYRLPAMLKFVVQIGSAFVAVACGVVIDNISIAGHYIMFGNWGVPITILWIVGLVNAINLIDGLDGLACGVSAICSTSLFFVILLSGDGASALIIALLAAACVGFLPFNKNPAKIFMGDTGALFLGYAFAVTAISGVFKLHTLISFMVPMSIFALPLLDTSIAFIRRIIHGRSPFSPDRGHLHHRLVDMGFSQKNVVRILYAITALLGLVAVVFTDAIFNTARLMKALLVLILAIVVFILNYVIIRNPNLRVHTGLFDDEPMPESVEKELEAAKQNNSADSESEDGSADGSEDTGAEPEVGEDGRD